jgi:hypothetical protein
MFLRNLQLSPSYSALTQKTVLLIVTAVISGSLTYLLTYLLIYSSVCELFLLMPLLTQNV